MTPSSWLARVARSCCLRSGPQSTSIRSPALSTKIEVLRRVLRGSSGSHCPHSLPIFGTPVDVPQPRMRTFNLLPLGFLEQFEEVGGRPFAELFRIVSPELRDEPRGIDDERGLAFLAAVRDGREEWRIRLDQHLVRRQPFGSRLQLHRVLEGHYPGQRHVKAEVETLARELGRTGEAVE